jgi:hypothetical protein
LHRRAAPASRGPPGRRPAPRSAMLGARCPTRPGRTRARASTSRSACDSTSSTGGTRRRPPSCSSTAGATTRAASTRWRARCAARGT